MSFFGPYALVFDLAVPLLVLLYLRMQQRRKQICACATEVWGWCSKPPTDAARDTPHTCQR
jgi:hypothetical protein